MSNISSFNDKPNPNRLFAINMTDTGAAADFTNAGYYAGLLSNGNYVIVAGSYNGTLVPAIYRWTGNGADAPLALPSFNVAGLNAEAVMGVNQGGILAADKLQIICDDGDNVFYNDGVAAKDLVRIIKNLVRK